MVRLLTNDKAPGIDGIDSIAMKEIFTSVGHV